MIGLYFNSVGDNRGNWISNAPGMKEDNDFDLTIIRNWFLVPMLRSPLSVKSNPQEYQWIRFVGDASL